MKKVISLVLLVFLLGGCSTVYPWEKAHIWYCDELDLTLTFTKDSSGFIAPPPVSPDPDSQSADPCRGTGEG